MNIVIIKVINKGLINIFIFGRINIYNNEKYR